MLSIICYIHYMLYIIYVLYPLYDLSIMAGAAIRGAVLCGVSTGLIKDVMMMDAIPQSIGLEVSFRVTG